jgi:hypothetical protein
MTFVQRAHRRHETDRAAGFPEPRHGTAQIGDGADDEKAVVLARVLYRID